MDVHISFAVRDRHVSRPFSEGKEQKLDMRGAMALATSRFEELGWVTLSAAEKKLVAEAKKLLAKKRKASEKSDEKAAELGFDKMSVAQLRELAKQEEIKGFSSMKKADLIEALTAAGG